MNTLDTSSKTTENEHVETMCSPDTEKEQLCNLERRMNTLKPVHECITCRMMLLPFKDEEGYHPAPLLFCDQACNRMFRLYHGVFAHPRTLE